MVIIIGILAAIAIPTFLAQRERAWEAAAQSDLRNAAAAATSCASGNANGAFVVVGGNNCGVEATLRQFGYNESENVNYAPDVVTADRWSGTTVNTNDPDPDTIYRFDTNQPAGVLEPQGRVYCDANCP